MAAIPIGASLVQGIAIAGSAVALTLLGTWALLAWQLRRQGAGALELATRSDQLGKLGDLAVQISHVDAALPAAEQGHGRIAPLMVAVRQAANAARPLGGEIHRELRSVEKIVQRLVAGQAPIPIEQQEGVRDTIARAQTRCQGLIHQAKP